MKLKIKRFDKSLPLPKYHTKGAVGLDMCARINVTILPKSVGYIPLNVAIELPKNCWAILAARSSTHKAGLIPINGVGIFDSDYCGNEDEYMFAVYNFTKKAVKIKKGERLAQVIILKKQPIEVVEARSLNSKNRGGFGTTGR